MRFKRARWLWVMVIGFLLSACTNAFFQPLKVHLASPEQYEIEYENIYFKSGDNTKLHGWWFPASLSGAEVSQGSILFLHGNGENISTHSGLVYWLTLHQYDVFIFDYRGYGYSEGKSEIPGVLMDIDSARKLVVAKNKNKNKNKPFFIIGHSLGASLGVVNLAQNSADVDGIIFVSPFSDYRKITREVLSNFWLTWPFQWPMSLTVSNEYNPVNYVAALPKVPKVFIYSDEDKVINAEHIKTLYAKAPLPKNIEMAKGQHNEVFAKQKTQAIILSYLQSWSASMLSAE